MADRVTDYRRALGRWALQNPDASTDPGTLSAYADQLLSMGDDELASLATAPQSYGPGGATQDPNKLIALAREQKGKRYAGPIVGESQAARWGDPGWDCSSFVSGMYRQLGIQITPFTDSAAKETTRIAPEEALPGDIIFFEYADKAQSGVKYPHMGIYLGNGQMIDSSYGRGVTERAIPQGLGTVHFHRAKGAEEFLQPQPATTPTRSGAAGGGGFDLSRITELSSRLFGGGDMPGAPFGAPDPATGQYYDRNGQPTVSPAQWRNQQRGSLLGGVGGALGGAASTYGGMVSRAPGPFGSFRTAEYNPARDQPTGPGPFGSYPIPNAPLGENPLAPENRHLLQYGGGDLQTGIGGTAATGLPYRTGFNPRTDKPQSWEEAAAFAADVAQNAGLGPEATKAVLAIMAQEGGWNGKTGDGGASHGALHFHSAGQLPAFARSMNMDPASAARLLDQAPLAGLDWAVRGYLGQPLRAAEEQGLAGPQVVAAGITGGQNPKANPQAYINQYTRLFGQGQGIPTMGGQATSASVAPRVGLPPVTAEDLSSPEGIWGAIGNTLLEAENLIAAIPTDPEHPASDPLGVKAKGIRDAAKAQIDLLTWAQDRSDTIGQQAFNQEIARQKLLLDQQGLTLTGEKYANDYRIEIAKLAQGDQQFQQTYGLNLRKYLESEFPAAQMALRGAEAEITGIDPITGMPIPAMQQWATEFPLKEAALTGEYLGMPTIGARTLEETIRSNQEALRMGWSTLQSRQAEAFEKAQREAEQAKFEMSHYALPQGTEYVPGMGPGGTASRISGMLGTNFTPTRYTPQNINPALGLEELRNAFGSALENFPRR